MGDRSGIEWTETTWNVSTGCDRTSPGCDNCYALTLARRLKAMGSPKYQNDGDPRTSGPGFALTLYSEQLELPYGWRAPRSVFVNSMSDLFHPDVPLEFIQRVFTVMADTPRHTYQILTKRSKRLASLASGLEWPSNVWMGVSVETSRYAFRLDHLRTVGAAVRFVSAEPLLGPLSDLDLTGLHWLIAGGESGPSARPMHESWVRDLRDQCAAAEIPFFFKQWGGRTPKPVAANSTAPSTMRCRWRCRTRLPSGLRLSDDRRILAPAQHPYEMRQPGMLSRPGTEFLLLS